MELECSIIYTPSTMTAENINFICIDDKIHLRFRDYTKPQIIQGFEKKLTYLVTYLMNCSYLNTLSEIRKPEMLIESFIDSLEMQTLKSIIEMHVGTKIKGFKLKYNYRKSECASFGAIAENAVPVQFDDYGNKIAGDLETFLSLFRINIEEYLFNDGYSVVIQSKNNREINKKFINKQSRKNNLDLNKDFVELW